MHKRTEFCSVEFLVGSSWLRFKVELRERIFFKSLCKGILGGERIFVYIGKLKY